MRELITAMPSSIRAWLDEDQLVVGQNIKDSLKAAIESSAFIIAVLSRTSVESDWVMFELKTAMEHESIDNKCVILPIVIDPITDKLPNFIRERRYLTLHDRSKQQVDLVSTELREGIATWALMHDPIATVIEEKSDLLKVASIEYGKTAALIGISLPDLLLKTIKAIYFKEVGGFESDDVPSGWLTACINTAVYDLRTSHASAAMLAEYYKQVLDQCFLIGYYATFLRRPIDGIEVDNDEEFDRKTSPVNDR